VDNFKSLKNKIILVTGASRGMGRSISCALLDNGSKVIGISKKKNSKSIIKRKNYYHFICDLGDENKIVETLNKIDKKFKHIDVLINNAGISIENTNLNKKNLEIFNETLKINLSAAYIFSYYLVKKFKQRKSGGTIINISSIGGELGFPNNPSYISSKTGLIGLTRSFARDYGKYNINCNAVLPGYFKTEMNKKSYNNRSKRLKRENLTMLGRWGELDELVSAVLFLASNGSKYITGQKIIVDGGIAAKGL
jgi:3-oxoacyl-[acyl-carrier protein] reductase